MSCQAPAQATCACAAQKGWRSLTFRPRQLCSSWPPLCGLRQCRHLGIRRAGSAAATVSLLAAQAHMRVHVHRETRCDAPPHRCTGHRARLGARSSGGAACATPRAECSGAHASPCARTLHEASPLDAVLLCAGAYMLLRSVPDSGRDATWNRQNADNTREFNVRAIYSARSSVQHRPTQVHATQRAWLQEQEAGPAKKPASVAPATRSAPSV